ncbi:GGDEF domain-containing protein [Sediminispirochaeta smaragdinae]|uniref:diguanylate cyclase n=1 Tax=Sediminispirochaeta smaragdinae (strain DSM 11293 / JCM 15392 / SEBR 4228) TaxID=573413 RepID=E1RC22_SEDSS|nr:GGDEF domain-containing protein [Sediminispirochaeta smaragdinae]ADK79902.1 diguanylate cyclase [Sediminispirochaeta smaragdinae DSM 11293]
MDVGLRINIDLFCSQIIVLLFAGIQDKRERKKLDYRFFTSMLLLVCITLFSDSAILLTEGTKTTLGQVILRNSTFLLFVSTPLISMLYAGYIELVTLPPHRRKRKAIVLYSVPALVNLSLCFISLLKDCIFAIDKNGYLYPGRFLHITTVVFYGYLAWAVILALSRKKTINPRVFQGLMSVPVPMAVGGVLQILLPKFVILLPTYTLSMIVLNSTIQERRLMYDYLTGAYNRRRLDEYLEALIQECRQSKKGFCAFLADVNDFKHINDQYGHVVGDEALIMVVKAMQTALRIDDFIARYAGDEFVVILPNANRAELDGVIARVHSAIETSSKSGCPYTLSLSIGGDEYSPSFQGDAEDFISYLDSLMYEEKNRYHETH